MTALEDDLDLDDLILTSDISVGGSKVSILTLNRPESRNPLDKVTLVRLKELLRELIDAGDVRTVILTGQGPAFSAGGDLKAYQTLYRDRAAYKAFLDDFDLVCRYLETAPFLTIAMVNGTCVAGGLELSLACDFITIADHARIGDGHLRFAQLPGSGGSQRLVRAIGVQRAKFWLLTGRLFTARDAVEAGLAILCAPADQLLDETLRIAGEVGALTPLGWRAMKGLVDTAQRTLLADGLDHESRTTFEYATTSHDATEGLLAFSERRRARYLGR